MIRLNSFVLGVTFYCLMLTFAVCQSNTQCAPFSDRLDPDTLYAASCPDASCLEKVVDDGSFSVLESLDGKERHPLERGHKYTFFYKAPADGMVNSLVVIQLKRLDQTPRTDANPAPVRIRRYGFHFACFRHAVDAHLAAWPPEEVADRDLTGIPYDKYDQFHRYGFTSAAEDRILREKFHVRYFNGRSCVSTLDPIRRSQFLLHDPQNFAGNGFESFLAEIGFFSEHPNPKEFDDVRKYNGLKVIVANYNRSKDASGCVSFPVVAGHSDSEQLDLVLRDIERQVQAYNGFYTINNSWSFKLQ